MAQAAAKDKENGKGENPTALEDFARIFKAKHLVPCFRLGFPALKLVAGASKESEEFVRYPQPNAKLSVHAKRCQVERARMVGMMVGMIMS